jgi:hypothetical protein
VQNKGIIPSWHQFGINDTSMRKEFNGQKLSGMVIFYNSHDIRCNLNSLYFPETLTNMKIIFCNMTPYSMVLSNEYHEYGLFKVELTDDPTCERCLEDDESATHILCDCEARAYFRFRHLGQFFMEPSDYCDAPVNKVLHFIRSVGLIKG